MNFEDAIIAKLEELSQQMQKLLQLNLQDSLLIFRKCVLPQLNHLLRTLDVDEDVWKEADKLVFNLIRKFLQRVQIQNFNKNLITLPLRFGGLGLSLPSMISSCCYKCSRSESFRLLEQLEPLLILPELEEKPQAQKHELKKMWENLRLEVVNNLEPRKRRIFIDNSSKIGTRWLHMLPVSKNLKLSDLDFAASVADRLLVQPDRCRGCDREVEIGHAASCKTTSRFRVPRHEFLKSSIAKAYRGSGADVTLEPKAISHDRRADILVNGEVSGGSCVLDLSVVAIAGTAVARVAVAKTNSIVPTHGEDMIKRSRQELQVILRTRHQLKLRRNADVDFEGTFHPWIISSGGTFEKSTEKLMKMLKKFSPREYDCLLFEISATLTKYRARTYEQCYLPNARRE